MADTKQNDNRKRFAETFRVKEVPMVGVIDTAEPLGRWLEEPADSRDALTSAEKTNATELAAEIAAARAARPQPGPSGKAERRVEFGPGQNAIGRHSGQRGYGVSIWDGMDLVVGSGAELDAIALDRGWTVDPGLPDDEKRAQLQALAKQQLDDLQAANEAERQAEALAGLRVPPGIGISVHEATTITPPDAPDYTQHSPHSRPVGRVPIYVATGLGLEPTPAELTPKAPAASLDEDLPAETARGLHQHPGFVVEDGWPVLFWRSRELTGYVRCWGDLEIIQRAGVPQERILASHIERLPGPGGVPAFDSAPRSKWSGEQTLREFLTEAGVTLPVEPSPNPDETPPPAVADYRDEPKLTYEVAAMMLGDALKREGLGAVLLARCDDSVQISANLGKASEVVRLSMFEAVCLADFIAPTISDPVWRLDDHRLRERCQALAREVKGRLMAEGGGAT